MAYALYAIWEQNHFMTDLDLAVRDQAIWLYSHFQTPRITSLVPPTHVLGDHFSPINVSLTPAYWVWPDPRTLLVAQAVLIAASVVPVFVFARDRLGRVGAYLLAVAYAAFWGISAAVGYQFHDIAFAPLLVAFCVLFADRGRWTAYFCSLAALLLVQENMSVLVVFIGLWLITGGERRRGLITVAVGIAAYFLITGVLMPAFADGRFTQWTYTSFGPDLPSSLVHIAGHPWQLVTELVDEPAKRRTLAYLFLPFLALVFGSRLVILCIPLIAQQMFSARWEFWGTDFHYWLTIAPVLAMGAADGFHNLLRRLRRDRSAARTGALVAAVILAINLGLATGYPLWTLVKPGFSLSATASDRAAERAMSQIPENASATVPAPQLPHMSGRSEIYLLGYPSPETDYVLFAPAALGWPDPAYARHWLDRHRSSYRLIYDRDGWVVWRRTA